MLANPRPLFELQTKMLCYVEKSQDTNSKIQQENSYTKYTSLNYEVFLRKLSHSSKTDMLMRLYKSLMCQQYQMHLIWGMHYVPS
jgi:sugar diacid utilization regulator